MRGEAELGMRVAMGFAATRETLSRSLSGADSAHRRPLNELSEKELCPSAGTLANVNASLR